MTHSPSFVALLFHSVDARSRLSLRGLGNVRPEIFEKLCRALMREFDIVGLRKLVDLISGEEENQGRFL